MRTDRFVLTENHLKLLRNANVGWDHGEYGAAAIDCKRPYGNSNVVRDLVELLEPGSPCDEDGEYHPNVVDRVETIHKQTKTALQIVLYTGTFQTGVYEADAYCNNWRLVK